MEKRVVDEKTKRKLQYLLGFGKDSFLREVPEMFLEFPQEYHPIFVLKPLSDLARKYIRNNNESGTVDKATTAKAIWDSGNRFENYRDGADFEKVLPCTEETLANMSDTVFGWL